MFLDELPPRGDVCFGAASSLDVNDVFWQSFVKNLPRPTTPESCPVDPDDGTLFFYKPENRKYHLQWELNHFGCMGNVVFVDMTHFVPFHLPELCIPYNCNNNIHHIHSRIHIKMANAHRTTKKQRGMRDEWIRLNYSSLVHCALTCNICMKWPRPPIGGCGAQLSPEPSFGSVE